MSVSISEAWNEPPEEEPRAVTARRGVLAPEVAEPPEREDAAATYLPRLLAELQDARREAARRCNVYLIVAGLLFAALFMYIDRLQSQVRRLNYNLHQRQFSQFAEGGRQLQPDLPPF